jgi:hypothetical protein
MKTLVSAIALLVGSNIIAIAADQTLKFKMVAFYVGEKDGEYHFVGTTVSPDGTIGTNDFYHKPGESGGTGHTTYYFPNGSLAVTYSGNAEERLAKLGGVGERLAVFSGRRRSAFHFG